VPLFLTFAVKKLQPGFSVSPVLDIPVNPEHTTNNKEVASITSTTVP